MIGSDTETHPFTPYCSAPKLVVLTMYSDPTQDHGESVPAWVHDLVLRWPNDAWLRFEGRQWFAAFTRAARWQAAFNLLDHATTWHHMPFDASVLAEYVPGALPKVFAALKAGRIQCTLIREKLLSVAKGTYQTFGQQKGYFSLAGCVKRYFRVDVEGKHGPDAWRTRYNELDAIPFAHWPKPAQDYALLDAKYGFDLWGVQAAQDPLDAQTTMPYILPNGNLVDQDRQFGAGFAMQLMSCEGVNVDGVEAAKTIAAWQKIAAKGKARGRKAGFIRADGSKNMKVMEARVQAAFDKLGIECPMTDGGDSEKAAAKGKKPKPPVPKTDAATLLISGDHELKAWGEASTYVNYLAKFGPALTFLDGSVGCMPNVLVATGRMSIMRPARQQPPKRGGYRECHVPPKGYVMSSTDYNQIELVCLAWVLEANGFGSDMADDIRAGIDLHYDMAVQIANEEGTHAPPVGQAWTYEVAVDCGKGLYGPAFKKLITKVYRTMAKIVNFGLPGGLGPKALRKYAIETYNIELSLDQAKLLIAVYKRRRPSMVKYFKDISDTAEYFGGTFTVVQPQSMRIRGGCHYTSACNTKFQGLASDGFKAALIRIVYEMYVDTTSPLFGSRLWLLVHDETLAYHPEAIAAEAAARLSTIMVEEMERIVPGIPVKAPPALMRRWYKEAEPVHDPVTGRLIPWSPT